MKMRSTHVDLVKLAEVHGLEAVDGGPDVFAVGALFHHLQLPYTGHVGQSGLNLSHIRNLTQADSFSSFCAILVAGDILIPFIKGYIIFDLLGLR